MKVIAFNGSPHEHGTVAKGIEMAGGELVKNGVELEVVQVGGKAIHGCMACGGCMGKHECAVKDPEAPGFVNECRKKMMEADGVILASPTYYGSIAGGFKCFLDRLFYPGVKMKYKAGAAIVSVRRTGGIQTFQQLNNYFNLANIITVPDFYWPVIHGNNADETTRDDEGMMCMRQAGRNMAWLIKALAAAKENIPLPEEEKRVFTNFIR
jgi:multimeric flavodoxin WrbA